MKVPNSYTVPFQEKRSVHICGVLSHPPQDLPPTGPHLRPASPSPSNQHRVVPDPNLQALTSPFPAKTPKASSTLPTSLHFQAPWTGSTPDFNARPQRPAPNDRSPTTSRCSFSSPRSLASLTWEEAEGLLTPTDLSLSRLPVVAPSSCPDNFGPSGSTRAPPASKAQPPPRLAAARLRGPGPRTLRLRTRRHVRPSTPTRARPCALPPAAEHVCPGCEFRKLVVDRSRKQCIYIISIYLSFRKDSSENDFVMVVFYSDLLDASCSFCDV